MKTGMVSNDGTAAYTNISPADMINKVSAVKGGRLFNMSCLRADNDSPSFFSDHSILDGDRKRRHGMGERADHSIRV